MQTDDIHFATGIAEERREAAANPAEWLLARRTVLGPVRIGNDQEEMLGVSADMCFPKVLDVVIVVDSSTPLHLSEDPAAQTNWVVEVWSGSRHDPHVSGEENLLLESELVPEQCRDDGLDGTALRPMDVRFLDFRLMLLQVANEILSKAVNHNEVGGLLLREVPSDASLDVDGHTMQLGSSVWNKLAGDSTSGCRRQGGESHPRWPGQPFSGAMPKTWSRG